MNRTVYESRLLVCVDDPYALHQHLWSMVSGHHDDRPMLYRADRLPEGYLVHVRMETCGAKHMDLAPVECAFREGDTYAFELRTVPERRDGHRVIATPRGEEAIPWLVERAERHGFSVDVSDAISQPLVFEGKRRRRITLNDTWFAGKLVITDPERFYDAYTRGIGRHRGFGFGLIQLANTH